MKNREKIVLKTMCFFDIDLLALFFGFLRFWLDFGRPRWLKKSMKIEKNSTKSQKIEKKSILRRALFGGRALEGFWEGFGSILGAFLERFWWILGGFWMDFGRILGRFLEGFDFTNND